MTLSKIIFINQKADKLIRTNNYEISKYITFLFFDYERSFALDAVMCVE